MKIELEILSKEIIKPFTPNSNHPSLHQLSFFDQITPPIFMPLILFYSKDSYPNLTNSKLSNQIKKSLSKTLTQFYPLAGRVKLDSLYVDCNDEGVQYVEANAKSKLSEILENPNPNELNKLLPFELDDANGYVLGVQVTFFGCNGIVIGLVMSHKVGDALSMLMFVNFWAATARGKTSKVACPQFRSAELFPPRILSGSDINPSYGITKNNIVAKIFVFSSSSIAALQDKYSDNTNHITPTQSRPSRVEALSAFLWSRFRATTQTKEDIKIIYAVLYAVNLRSRTNPPLPETCFGNISQIAIAIATEDNEDECYGITKRAREAIKKIDLEYAKKIKENDDDLYYLRESSSRESVKQEMISFAFSSLCRLPIYDADFGWGKPVWVGSARLTYPNLVTFLDTKFGDGIEAWINLTNDDMTKFETDKELLDYVSPSH